MTNQGKVLRNMFLTSNLNKHIKKCKITFQVDKWISFELSFVTLETRGQVERIALWYTVKLCHSKSDSPSILVSLSCLIIKHSHTRVSGRMDAEHLLRQRCPFLSRFCGTGDDVIQVRTTESGTRVSFG